MPITPKKQLKITTLFRKQTGSQLPVPEDPECKELEEEIRQLQQKLDDKKIELFRVQRNSYKCKVASSKNKSEQIIRPDKIQYKNIIEHQERQLELMAMLTGMEVKSYVTDEHCVVVYHMQHPSNYHITHGLKINMQTDAKVSKYSLPSGFNFNAVVEEFDNIMSPECLGALRKALVAYYNRIQQFEDLKNVLHEAQLYKVMDGTHIEISFKAQSERHEDHGVISVVLMLDYRVYDIRPKVYTVKGTGLPEGASELLDQQCAVFKRKPLQKAFTERFIDGIGPYMLVRPVQPELEPAPRPRKRRPQHQARNDDTFRPEDESASSEDEDEMHLRNVYGRRG